VRVLIDYRPALRQRSGVGEYTHRLVQALASLEIDLTLFSSSWKDRLDPVPLSQVSVADRRYPVRLLNLAWHRLGWPPIETIAGGSFDVAHSMHPLLMPSRTAARVITIYDLHFLEHPERTRGEIRRDYPALARDHARRADHVVTISRYTAAQIIERFEVPADRISICPPGPPDWLTRNARPPRDAYVLFVGTLEPRKNLGILLDAYERLVSRRPMPRLVVAGAATPDASEWVARMRQPWAEGKIEYRGYVDPERRRDLYLGAGLLVQPSFDEGFGIPVLEAMSTGVPVIASNRGALPEVLGDAGILIDPENPDALASAIERMVDDEGFAAASIAKGEMRARQFSWDASARMAREAYRLAIEQRTCASG